MTFSGIEKDLNVYYLRYEIIGRKEENRKN